MRWLAPALLYVSLTTAVHAADSVVGVGEAQVRFDRERWRASAAGDSIQFQALGKIAGEQDDAELHVRDDAPCGDLALQAFAFCHYDTGNLEATPISIGGVAGERFEAHTGCRNATPRGVVACVKVRGRAYLLTSLNAGCEGRNLFSGIDPIAEIAAGISFGAVPR